ncbi:uncharacterized protein LOC132641435 [Lycium barbarum]|uniref:uncharacterized protein LOC132641435 n=1 Tax=Lycium barbarum TaxID=112863 RepID=UPI00293F456C|nr:uncharacterized protein LOC132641435 [Lycium barbarum]
MHSSISELMLLFRLRAFTSMLLAPVESMIGSCVPYPVLVRSSSFPISSSVDFQLLQHLAPYTFHLAFSPGFQLPGFPSILRLAASCPQVHRKTDLIHSCLFRDCIAELHFFRSRSFWVLLLSIAQYSATHKRISPLWHVEVLQSHSFDSLRSLSI